MKVVRIEVYPNALSATHAGDFLVPVYEVDGREQRGAPYYIYRDPAPPDVQLAAEIMVDVERRLGRCLRDFFSNRPEST